MNKTKIKEIIIEAKEPLSGRRFELAVDITAKKILIIENEDSAQFFVLKQVTRADIDRHRAALDILETIMDEYFKDTDETILAKAQKEMKTTKKPVTEATITKEIKTTEKPVPVSKAKKEIKTMKKQPPAAKPKQSVTEPKLQELFDRTCRYCGTKFQAKRAKAFMCSSKECLKTYNREYAQKRRS